MTDLLFRLAYFVISFNPKPVANILNLPYVIIKKVYTSASNKLGINSIGSIKTCYSRSFLDYYIL